MTSDASSIAAPQPFFTVRRAMLAIAVVALIVVAAFAALRQWQRAATNDAASSAAASTPAVADRPALTADEERYARDLWNIHEQVRTNVPRLSFAGLAYKMGDIGKADIAARIAPVTKVLASARSGMQALTPPPSLAAAHREYLDAIETYQQVLAEMGSIATDGNEEHLVKAQVLSERASSQLLKVSEVLWPGEHKPN